MDNKHPFPLLSLNTTRSTYSSSSSSRLSSWTAASLKNKTKPKLVLQNARECFVFGQQVQLQKKSTLQFILSVKDYSTHKLLKTQLNNTVDKYFPVSLPRFILPLNLSLLVFRDNRVVQLNPSSPVVQCNQAIRAHHDHPRDKVHENVRHSLLCYQ